MIVMMLALATIRVMLIPIDSPKCLTGLRLFMVKSGIYKDFLTISVAALLKVKSLENLNLCNFS